MLFFVVASWLTDNVVKKVKKFDKTSYVPSFPRMSKLVIMLANLI